MDHPAHVRRLTSQQIADALDVALTKSSQAANPAIEKVARLMVLHPAETWGHLAMAMAQVQAERERMGAAPAASA